MTELSFPKDQNVSSDILSNKASAVLFETLTRAKNENQKEME